MTIIVWREGSFSAISSYDILEAAAESRHNRRHEEAHLVGLPGAGGVPLPDPPLPPFQRASGQAGGTAARPVPAYARNQGYARRCAPENRRTSQPHGDPPP